MKPNADHEPGHCYAVITLTNGQKVQCGPFRNRTIARRFAINENERHRWSVAHHGHYSARFL